MTLTHTAGGTPALSGPRATRLRFGRFELQLPERQLVADGQPAALGGRAIDLLIALAEQPGCAVSRTALLDRVWPDIDVEENNLSVQVNALRKVLGPGTIVTIPGRGYQIALAVEAAGASALPAGPDHGLRTNLPDVLPALIGRTEDLRGLAELVDRQRLVTVIGAGGVGKSMLVRRLLHERRARYEQGVCFVELSPLSQPEDVPAAVAAALGVRLPGGSNAQQALVSALAPLEVLLALDNAEHLLAAVAATAAALRGGAPRVRLLVTSQAPLKVADEWLFRLDGLPGSDAVALFAERARALDRRFTLQDGHAEGVAELCDRLDGNPLAIELAAARLRLMGLAALLASLDQRLHLLANERSGVARQRTLRAALEWSHGLLTEQEQRIFRRLAVFAGSASLAVLAQVVGDHAPGSDPLAVLDGLGNLVDRSLVDLVPDPRGAEHIPRYRLLDTPRVHARERLHAADEVDDMRGRLARAMRVSLQQHHAELLDGRWGFDAWLAAIRPDIDDAKACLNWGLEHGDTALVLALAPAVLTGLGGNRYTESMALLDAVAPLLDAPGSLAVPAAWRAATALRCATCVMGTQPPRALALSLQAASLAQEAGDRRLRYLALSQVAWSHGVMGEPEALNVVLQELVTLHDVTWCPYLLSLGLPGAQFWACMLAEDYAGALRCSTEQMLLRRAAGWTDVSPDLNRILVQTAAGDVDGAIDTGRALTRQLATSRNQAARCRALVTLCDALLSKPLTAEAREVLLEVWPLTPRYGMRPVTIGYAAWLAAAEARPRAVLRLLGAADAAHLAAGFSLSALGAAERATMEAQARAALAPHLDAAACGRLLSEGGALDEDGLTELAFSTADD